MTTRIPPKPTHRKRSPFYWWRRFRVHKSLKPSAKLIDKIENGDFDYPQFFKEAEYEMHWMKEELEEFVNNYKGFQDPRTDTQYMDIERKYYKRRTKLFEDGYNTELDRLNRLVDALHKTFGLDKFEIRSMMEEFPHNLKKFYFHCKDVARTKKVSYIKG